MTALTGLLIDAHCCRDICAVGRVGRDPRGVFFSVTLPRFGHGGSAALDATLRRVNGPWQRVLKPGLIEPEIEGFCL